MENIPLFTGFHTSQVVISRISQPSTVWQLISPPFGPPSVSVWRSHLKCSCSSNTGCFTSRRNMTIDSAKGRHDENQKNKGSLEIWGMDGERKLVTLIIFGSGQKHGTSLVDSMTANLGSLYKNEWVTHCYRVLATLKLYWLYFSWCQFRRVQHSIDFIILHCAWGRFIGTSRVRFHLSNWSTEWNDEKLLAVKLGKCLWKSMAGCCPSTS